MLNYNQTSFALVGVLEQANDAITSLSYGSTFLSDMQQSMLNIANAILQFAIDDATGTYTVLSTPAFAFVNNYTGAFSLEWSELWDFQNLMRDTNDVVSQDFVVASAAARAYADMQLHSDSVAWSSLMNGSAIVNPTVSIIETGAPFMHAVLADNHMLMTWEMDDQNPSGFFNSYFGYSMSIENSDGSQAMIESGMDLYATYSPYTDPSINVYAGGVGYTYLG